MNKGYSMEILTVLGVLVIILFYGSYLGKQLLLRRQGIFANRLGRGNKPKRTYVIEVLLKSTTFSMAAVQVMSLIVGGQWYLLIQSNTVRYMGIVISFAGAAIFITAMAAMKSSWRAGVDASQRTKLVRNGIYRVSRNPAFLGFDLFYIGFTIAFSNPVQLLFLVCCVATLHLQILEEEKFLPVAFGKEYVEYKKSTGRYFMYF